MDIYILTGTTKEYGYGTNDLTKKWEHSGLLDGLEGILKPEVASLFESKDSFFITDVVDCKKIDDLYNYESSLTNNPINKKPIKIGFNLDDVIRATSERVYWFYIKFYLKKYGVEPNLNYEDLDLSNIKKTLGLSNEAVELDNDSVDEDGIIDLTKISNDNYNDGLSEYETFIEENYLDIFGNSKEVYKGVSNDLNNLFELMNENNIKPIIIQRESGIIRNATLFFLSDKGIGMDQINFIKTYEEAFEHCDYLVAANPNFLNINPNKTIKINTHYNKHIKVKYELDKIKEMFELVLNIN